MRHDCWAWRKSSYSSGQGECVEVATSLPGVVAVSDSKNPHGPVLTVSTGEWARFTRRLRAATISRSPIDE